VTRECRVQLEADDHVDAVARHGTRRSNFLSNEEERWIASKQEKERTRKRDREVGARESAEAGAPSSHRRSMIDYAHDQWEIAKRRNSMENRYGVMPEKLAPPRGGRFWQYQTNVRRVYMSATSQKIIAALIILNFLANAAEKQYDPIVTLGKRKSHWVAYEITFSVLFLVELLINMYGSWFWPFVVQGWNWFDVVVVAVGLLSATGALDGFKQLRLLRTLRAFRVFRLFKRVESLNRILTMIVSAVPGVLNALVVLVVSIAIWAIIGVEFFASFGVGVTSADNNNTNPETLYDVPIGQMTGYEFDEYLIGVTRCVYTSVSFEIASAESAREMCSASARLDPSTSGLLLCCVWPSWLADPEAKGSNNSCLTKVGDEYFGSFTRAYFTLIQVLTGDSWAESIARPIMFGWHDFDNASSYIAFAYFASFTVVNTFIIFNVFIAILLDKMLAPDPPSLEEGEIEDEMEQRFQKMKEHAAHEAAEVSEEAHALFNEPHVPYHATTSGWTHAKGVGFGGKLIRSNAEVLDMLAELRETQLAHSRTLEVLMKDLHELREGSPKTTRGGRRSSDSPRARVEPVSKVPASEAPAQEPSTLTRCTSERSVTEGSTTDRSSSEQGAFARCETDLSEKAKGTKRKVGKKGMGKTQKGRAERSALPSTAEAKPPPRVESVLDVSIEIDEPTHESPSRKGGDSLLPNDYL